MAYEIDFVGVGKEVKKDADAICMRWKVRNADGSESYKVGVYDGGFEAHGVKMVEHMNRYYFDDPENKKDATDKVVEFVVVSHPDEDHVIGLKNVLENFTVKKLVMNRPWLYVEELWSKVNDGRITKESLEERLRRDYAVIDELEKIANKKGIPIVEAFQGVELDDGMVICSPSKQFYLDLLVESQKTPLVEDVYKNALIKSFKEMRNYVSSLVETWSGEMLREDVETSAENETSVVIRGIIDGSGFLLCGDAGIRALTEAMNYLDSLGEDIRGTVSFYEIPHHGSRHNVSTSLLDRMIGKKVKRGELRGCSVFASVASESDHPLRMVTNAFIRRGVKVYKTSGNILRHFNGDMPKRDWGKADAIEFQEEVEEWD